VNPQTDLIADLKDAARQLGLSLRVHQNGAWQQLAGDSTPHNGAVTEALLQEHALLPGPIEVWAPPSSPNPETLINAFRLIADRTAAVADAQEANAELADSLSKAFDRADVTMAVAAAQRSVSRPDRFVIAACEEVRSTIGFEWTGIIFERAATIPASLAETTLFSVEPSWEPHDAEQAALALAESTDASDGPWVARYETPDGDRTGVGLIQPFEIEHRTAGVLVGGWSNDNTMSLNSYHLSLAESVCAFLGPFMENLLLHERDRGRFFATLEALSSTLDAKDPYTRGHSERVAQLALRLGKALKVSARELEHLEIAGRLHDVGKIGVPEAILLKPARLTDAEFDEIKRHPSIGYEILKGVPGLEPILPGVLHHHERWDGNGYPAGLHSKEIPFQARILAVADTFDAMSSKRSYRDSVPRDIVLKVIDENRGTQFDPTVAEAFLSLDISWYDAALNKTLRSAAPSDRRAA